MFQVPSHVLCLLLVATEPHAACVAGVTESEPAETTVGSLAFDHCHPTPGWGLCCVAVLKTASCAGADSLTPRVCCQRVEQELDYLSIRYL